MTRFGIAIAAVSVLLVMSFSNPGHIAYGQARSFGTDTIRFVGAKQGVNYDSSPTLGERWCWVTQNNGTGWHGYWVANVELNPPTGNPVYGNALDEVAQLHPYASPPAAFSSYCPSVDGSNNPLAPLAQFRLFGKTDNTQCTMVNPCPSLVANGRSGRYAFGPPCAYIEVDLYDAGTWGTSSLPDGTRQLSGDWKGRSRMIHAMGQTSWNITIFVAQDGWILTTVDDAGTVVAEPTTCPWSQPNGYHVHHDFMPSTTGTLCLLNKNAALAPTTPLVPSPNPGQTDKQRMVPGDWVHSLTHQYNGPCYNLGPAVADILLGANGMTDGNLDSLRNCPPAVQKCSFVTPGLVTLPGTSWKGYIVVDDSVLKVGACLDQALAAIDCVRATELPIPSSGNTAHVFQYGPDAPGYYMQVWWYADGNPPSGTCYANPGPQSLYWVDLKGSTGGTCNLQGWNAITNPPTERSYGFSVDNDGGFQTVWSQFRGTGGANPSAVNNMTSTDWRTWAQRQSYDRLRSLLRTGISAATSWHALTAIEIRSATGNPYNSPDFECSNKPPTDETTWSSDFSEACRVYYNSTNP